MYFVGRIDARSPGYDLQTALIRLVRDPKIDTTLQADAQRCGAVLQQRGDELTKLGEALKRETAKP